MTWCTIPDGIVGKVSLGRIITPGECDEPRATLFHEERGFIMAEWGRLLHDMDPVVEVASGRVLLGGLGLGIVLARILAKPIVSEVVVLENDLDVIALCGAPFAGDPRVVLVAADAFTAPPEALGQFDAGWFDLWSQRVPDDEAALIEQRWAPWCTWFDTWRARA